LPAAGLVLLSYPLHPPGRPDQLRIAHLPEIRVPVLAVSGSTDPFGSPEELAEHLAAIPGPVTTVFLPGPHLPTSATAVADAVGDWLGTLDSR
jgi:predicted alpha/beta-hydrolase family hydrolase